MATRMTFKDLTRLEIKIVDAFRDFFQKRNVDPDQKLIELFTNGQRIWLTENQ